MALKGEQETGRKRVKMFAALRWRWTMDARVRKRGKVTPRGAGGGERPICALQEGVRGQTRKIRLRSILRDCPRHVARDTSTRRVFEEELLRQGPVRAARGSVFWPRSRDVEHTQPMQLYRRKTLSLRRSTTLLGMLSANTHVELTLLHFHIS